MFPFRNYYVVFKTCPATWSQGTLPAVARDPVLGRHRVWKSLLFYNVFFWLSAINVIVEESDPFQQLKCGPPKLVVVHHLPRHESWVSNHQLHVFLVFGHHGSCREWPWLLRTIWVPPNKCQAIREQCSDIECGG